MRYDYYFLYYLLYVIYDDVVWIVIIRMCKFVINIFLFLKLWVYFLIVLKCMYLNYIFFKGKWKSNVWLVYCI